MESLYPKGPFSSMYTVLYTMDQFTWSVHKWGPYMIIYVLWNLLSVQKGGFMLSRLYVKGPYTQGALHQKAHGAHNIMYMYSEPQEASNEELHFSHNHKIQD